MIETSDTGVVLLDRGSKETVTVAHSVEGKPGDVISARVLTAPPLERLRWVLWSWQWNRRLRGCSRFSLPKISRPKNWCASCVEAPITRPMTGDDVSSRPPR